MFKGLHLNTLSSAVCHRSLLASRWNHTGAEHRLMQAQFSFAALQTRGEEGRVWKDLQTEYWSLGWESVGGVREHAARQPGWWSCGRLKSSGGDVTTVMKSLWWLGEGRSPLTFDSGSLGSTQHWTPLGSFNTRTHTHSLTHSNTHTSTRTHILPPCTRVSHAHTKRYTLQVSFHQCNFCQPNKKANKQIKLDG